MHEFQFSDSVLPQRAVVLRLTLRPYSIGHDLILLSQRNPIVLAGFEGLPIEEQCFAVIRAALVCSQTWKQNQRPHRWLKLWRWLNRKTDYVQAIKDFMAYREAGLICPPPPDDEASLVANGEEKPGRRLGGPAAAQLYNFVATLPESEIQLWGDSVMDFPMGMASFLHFTQLEADGALKIENQKEAQIRMEMADIRNAVKKEKEVPCQT